VEVRKSFFFYSKYIFSKSEVMTKQLTMCLQGQWTCWNWIWKWFHWIGKLYL